MSDRVLLYGGAFDPPHTGHMKIANCALTHFNTEAYLNNYGEVKSELWFLPSMSNDFHAQSDMEHIDHRIQMLELMLSDAAANGYYQNFSVCTDEVNAANNAGTYAVVKNILRRYPDKEFIYVIGSDQARNINNWRNSRKLRMIIQFIVVRRAGFLTFHGSWWKDERGSHIYLDKPSASTDPVSSSEIRKDLYSNKYKLLYHPKLNEPVLDYIRHHGLYKKN